MKLESMDLTPLFPRYIQPRLLEALEDTPVILIHGAHQTGKRSSPSILGQMLESFVYQELRRQSAWGDRPVAFHHFRTRDRVEVDLVL